VNYARPYGKPEVTGESYANDIAAWYGVHNAHARSRIIRIASADSCGIMQFAHETYGNARFPCGGTKLQTRVFHSSSFFDDSTVTIGQTLFQLNIYPPTSNYNKYVNTKCNLADGRGMKHDSTFAFVILQDDTLTRMTRAFARK